MSRCFFENESEMVDIRVFLLTGDSNADFLIRMDIGGVMSQPDFFRAVDTTGNDMEIPSYIDSSDELLWNK